MVEIHATALALAVGADAPLFGLLLTGPSGSGKSTLALALIERCREGRTRLVADDLVTIENRRARLVASGGRDFLGEAELRGVGVLRVPALPRVTLRLALRLGEPPTRLADPAVYAPWGVEGDSIPSLPAPRCAPIGIVSLCRSVANGHNPALGRPAR